MRLALFSPLPPEASGIADYADLFRNALVGHGVEVVAPVPGGQWPQHAHELSRLADTMDLSGFDVAHFELGGGRIRPFLMLRHLLARHKNTVFTATVHDPERLAWRGWGLSRFERLPRCVQQALTVVTDPLSVAREQQAAQRLDAMVTLTHGGADALALRMRVPRGKIHVIPHGVSSAATRALPSLQPVKVLFFGYVFPGKGIEGLLQALVLLRERNAASFTDIRLTISGGSAPSMMLRRVGDYVGELRAEVQRLGLSEHVSFETDLAEARIPELIQDHHVMVLPYEDSHKLSLLGRYLGSSGAAAWAIASGRGLLVTDARAMPEAVSAGNGAVFAQRQPAALAELFERIVAERSLLSHWARAAEQLAAERAWPRIAAHFIDVFNGAIAARPSAPAARRA